MNKYTIGTILGTSLLSLIKTEKGSAAKKVGIMFEHRVIFEVTLRNWKMVQIITNNQDATVNYLIPSRKRQYNGVVFENPENPYIKQVIVWTWDMEKELRDYEKKLDEISTSYGKLPKLPKRYIAIFDITFYSKQPTVKVFSGEDNQDINPEIWKMIRRTIPSLYDDSNNMTSWWKGLAVKNRPKVSNAFLDGPLKFEEEKYNSWDVVQTVSKQNKRRKKEYGSYYMELHQYNSSFIYKTTGVYITHLPGSTVSPNKVSKGIPMKVTSDGSIVPFDLSKGGPKLRRR